MASASPEVRKIAGSISFDDADDFASTKHDGLPERKKKDESVGPIPFEEWVKKKHYCHEGKPCRCGGKCATRPA